jgi:hypothetical protein
MEKEQVRTDADMKELRWWGKGCVSVQDFPVGGCITWPPDSSDDENYGIVLSPETPEEIALLILKGKQVIRLMDEDRFPGDVGQKGSWKVLGL